jgi:hypothetical protein
MKDLSVDHKAAILLGLKAGDDQIDKYIASGGKVINGWNVGSFVETSLLPSNTLKTFESVIWTGSPRHRQLTDNLPRFEKKLRVALEWTLDYRFEKDLVQFQTLRAPILPDVTLTASATN